MLGFVTLQCAHLCSPALWLPPYDLGLGGDFRTSEAAVSEGELGRIREFQLRERLGLVYKRGATDQHGSQMRERELFPTFPTR